MVDGPERLPWLAERNPQRLRTTRDNGPADAGARGLGEIAVVSAGDFQTRIEMPHRGAGSRVLLLAAAEHKEGDFCLLCRLRRVMEEVRRGDRKSTRLNSSH